MSDTVDPADSIEFCPHKPFQNIFVCGTYRLEDSNENEVNDIQSPKPRTTQRKRTGTLLLYKADIDDSLCVVCSMIQKVGGFPAVLDMKWSHEQCAGGPQLGIADSEGNVSIFKLSAESLDLVHLKTVQCATQEDLCLSLDWSNRRFNGMPGSLVVSLSDGNLCLLQPDDLGGLNLTKTWKGHEFEPWIAAWNYWDTSIIYSGGDDCKLKAWDIRQESLQPIFTNTRFEAGVTSIQSNPHIEHVVAVGSYDDSVRLFDMRKPLTPLIQASVGGGAWRVKWHPSPMRSQELLVACMYDGFKVLRFAGTTGEATGLEVTKRFDRHQSLAYGADWSFNETSTQTLIGSCSFYDHLLCTWRG